MALIWLMALQAASPDLSATAASDFDLAKYRPSERRCGEAYGSEIIVCGRRRVEVPLEMDPRWLDKPLKAEIGLAGGARIRAYGESVDMPGGQISKRAMIGIKLPF